MASYYATLFPIFEEEGLSNQINPKAVIPKFAAHDVETVLNFLKKYNKNEKNYLAYRCEMERLLLWVWLIAKKSVLNFKPEDIPKYIKFRLHPPTSWVGEARINDFRFIEEEGITLVNPFWRPYNSNIKNSSPNKHRVSQKEGSQIFKILGSFFNYITSIIEEIDKSLLSLLEQERKQCTLHPRSPPPTIKPLTEIQWKYCLETAKQMADSDPSHHEKTLFLISIFYLLSLQAFELTARVGWTPQMNHFYQDSNQKWWFKVQGRFKRIRDIPVSEEMLKSLIRYRVSKGLTPLPVPTDSTPLLSKEKGKGGVTTAWVFVEAVKYCFDITIERLREDNLLAEANAMEKLTITSLREKGIIDDIHKRHYSIRQVQEKIGRNLSATTQEYQDIQSQERHKSARNKKLIEDLE